MTTSNNIQNKFMNKNCAFLAAYALFAYSVDQGYHVVFDHFMLDKQSYLEITIYTQDPNFKIPSAYVYTDTHVNHIEETGNFNYHYEFIY